MSEENTPLATWREQYSKNPDLLAVIEKAAAEFGEDEIIVLDLVKPKGQTAIFRAPRSSEYQRFTTSILGDKADHKARAAEILARNCVVYPAKEVFAEWIERYAGIGAAVIKPLTRLAGAEASERGKE